MDKKATRNFAWKIMILAAVIVILIASLTLVPKLTSNAQIPQAEPFNLSALPELELPDSRIIAIGTPTHGNTEPIRVTLDILKRVYEKYGAVACILEEIAGEAEIINRQHSYTKEDGSKAGMYLVYDNAEISDILNWLEKANRRLYGIDIQSIFATVMILRENLDELKFHNAERVLNLSASSNQQIEQNILFLDEIEKFIGEQLSEGKISERDSAYLLHLSDCVRMNYDYVLSGYSFSVRDEMMAKNVEWIMDYERAYFDNERAVLFASNGHIIKSAWSYTFSEEVYSPMGSLLAKRYGEDYYAILTDARENYFEASTNMKNAANKKVFHIFNDSPAPADSGSNVSLILSGDCGPGESQERKLVIVGSVFTGFRALRDKYYTAWISPEESCDALLYFDLMTPVRKAD